MYKRLDFPIAPLPDLLSHWFVMTVNEETFRYEARVDNIKFCSNFSIMCCVRIRKLKEGRLLSWLKPVWSFSAEFKIIINWNGKICDDHRHSLVTEAINNSVMPTDLLLDKLLGTIEAKLALEHERIISLHGSETTESQRAGEQAANE